MVKNKKPQNALQKQKWKWWWQWTMQRHQLQGKIESESDDYINCTFPIQPQQLFSRQIWHPGSIHQPILFDTIKSPNSSFSFHLRVGHWLPYCSANGCNQCHWNVEYLFVSSLDKNHLELGSQKKDLHWHEYLKKVKTISGEQNIPFLAHLFSLTQTFFYFSPFFQAHFLGTVFWARIIYLDRKANWTNPGREDSGGLGGESRENVEFQKSWWFCVDRVVVTLSISIAKSCDCKSCPTKFACAGAFTSEVGLSLFGWLSLFHLVYVVYLYINERYLCFICHIWMASQKEHMIMNILDEYTYMTCI